MIMSEISLLVFVGSHFSLGTQNSVVRAFGLTRGLLGGLTRSSKSDKSSFSFH